MAENLPSVSSHFQSSCKASNKSGIHIIFSLFLHENMLWVLIRSALAKVLLMSTYNIYFCGEIRKMSVHVFFACKSSYLELCVMFSLVSVGLQ